MKYKTNFIVGIIALSTVLLIGTSTQALASGSRSRAQRFLLDERFEDALEEYEIISADRPDDAGTEYNRAIALYRKGLFDEAERSFIRAALLGQRALEAKAAYNAANAKFRQGERLEMTRPEEAMEKYASAMDYYRRAIELDPSDPDAKFNYEFLSRRMEELEKIMEQQEREQEPPTERDDDPDEEPEDRERPEPVDDKEDEEQQEDSEKGEGHPEDGEDDQETPSDIDPSDTPEERPDAPEREPARPDMDSIELGDDAPAAPDPAEDWSPGDMTGEQLEMLLRQQEEEEARTREQQKQERRAERPPVLKDW